MGEPPPSDDVELVLAARTRDLGGFTVGRVLPAPKRRAVGPFVFLDHMGPVELGPGHELSVRPHPHIGLATVTYLFEGEIQHHDSLDCRQRIQPGAINWMTAGAGISHSERTPLDVLLAGGRLHGLQLWCALPHAHEEIAPSFVHYPAAALPVVERDGATIRVLAGAAYGVTSPVETLSRLFYIDVAAPTGVTLDAPNYPERAVYVVEGWARIGGHEHGERELAVLASGRTVAIEARPGTRLVMLGGEPLDGPRHLDWNFVSSSPERIAAARRAWRDKTFPLVPGEPDVVPLPE